MSAKIIPAVATAVLWLPSCSDEPDVVVVEPPEEDQVSYEGPVAGRSEDAHEEQTEMLSESADTVGDAGDTANEMRNDQTGR